MATASILDRPVRERVERLAARLPDLLPAAPPPAFLHGDLWSGNILVAGGRLAALIDPACYGGAQRGRPGDAGAVRQARRRPSGTPTAPLDPGWEERRPVYQLFPALVHLRLFGADLCGHGRPAARALLSLNPAA